jgi:Raf kinase inhibitor-like YbhB/YbcL family protein
VEIVERDQRSERNRRVDRAADGHRDHAVGAELPQRGDVRAVRHMIRKQRMTRAVARDVQHLDPARLAARHVGVAVRRLDDVRGRVDAREGVRAGAGQDSDLHRAVYLGGAAPPEGDGAAGAGADLPPGACCPFGDGWDCCGDCSLVDVCEGVVEVCVWPCGEVVVCEVEVGVVEVRLGELVVFCVRPPKRVVSPLPATDPPKISSGTVSATRATMNATSPVASASPRRKRRRREYVRIGPLSGARELSPAVGAGGRGGGIARSGGTSRRALPASTGTRTSRGRSNLRVPTVVGATARTRATGRRTTSLSSGRASSSFTIATITGVIAAVTIVPPRQKVEVTIAAAADATAAMTSVWTERPSRRGRRSVAGIALCARRVAARERCRWYRRAGPDRLDPGTSEVHSESVVKVVKAAAVAAAAVALGACGSTPTATTVKRTGRLTLTSPAFSAGGSIPRRFTCDGAGTSPPLRFSRAPAGAPTLALTVVDPDAPGGNFTHWVAFDVPAGTTALAQGSLPPGSRQARNDLGQARYGGPCPPRGDPAHRYVFTVYALSRRLTFADGASADAVEAAVTRSAIATGVLIGRYGR